MAADALGVQVGEDAVWIVGLLQLRVALPVVDAPKLRLVVPSGGVQSLRPTQLHGFLFDLAIEVALLMRGGYYVPESEVDVESLSERAQVPDAGAERAHPDGRDSDFGKQKIEELGRVAYGDVDVLNHRLGPPGIGQKFVGE